jgi:hypothetical protein
VERRLESELLREWREVARLRFGALGKRCPRPLTARSVRGFEERPADGPSVTTENLLNLAIGLGIPGDTDAQRLARFFVGPEPVPLDPNDQRHRIKAGILGALDQVYKKYSKTKVAAELEFSPVDMALLQSGVISLTIYQLRRLCELSDLSADEVLELPPRLPLEMQEALRAFLKDSESIRKAAETLGKSLRRLEAENMGR